LKRRRGTPYVRDNIIDNASRGLDMDESEVALPHGVIVTPSRPTLLVLGFQWRLFRLNLGYMHGFKSWICMISRFFEEVRLFLRGKVAISTTTTAANT
jgi:hypothetical protein